MYMLIEVILIEVMLMLCLNILNYISLILIEVILMFVSTNH